MQVHASGCPAATLYLSRAMSTLEGRARVPLVANYR